MSRILNDDDDNNSLKNNEETMTDDEHMDEIEKLNARLSEKIIENENYQQELYELRQKLKACLATQKDLSDANEMMEDNVNQQKLIAERKMNNLLEKFSIDKKTYEERLSELQSKLALEEKKNEELRETLNAKDKLLIASKSDNPDNSQENSLLKNQIYSLTEELKERFEVEEELLSKQRQLEDTLAVLEKNYDEVNDILQSKKEDLASLKETLEATRNELVICRSELESLKAIPASDSMKGNSLFAEVEDSRREIINDMTTLRRKYIQMKQTYDSKENELRLLKAERAVLLRKWEDDNVENVNHGAKLIDAYKSRISELESRLKIEEKKLKMKETEDNNKKKPIENNFSYLQSLLTTKKKEVEELHKKLAECSAEKTLQEEVKYEMSKQLRQWRYKAKSYQAQLLTMVNQTDYENCLKMKLNDSGDADLSKDTNDDDSDIKFKENIVAATTDRFETTLEKLLKIPTVSDEESEKNSEDRTTCEINDIVKSDESVAISQPEKSTTIPKEKITACAAKPMTSRKSNTRIGESDKENSASTSSNARAKTLKPSLVKSEDKKLRFNIQDKTKKNLRFTSDTVDSQKPKLSRQKVEKKAHPVVFISNQLKK